jgi:hypothetical protein
MWSVCAFEHDRPSREISQFFCNVWGRNNFATVRAPVVNPKQTYNVNKTPDVLRVTKEVSYAGTLEDSVLTLYGYGGSHHYTYGFCNHIAKPRAKEYLYVHIDHHSDAGPATTSRKFNKSNRKWEVEKGVYSLGCGSFVLNLKKLGAKEFSFIGATGKLTGPKFKNASHLPQDKLFSPKKKGLEKVIKKDLRSKECKDVYISMDLDVLAPEEISTGFSRGKIKLWHLLTILDEIKQHKNIIGADILGYRDRYVSTDPQKNKQAETLEGISYLTYLCIVCNLLGIDYKDIEEAREKMIVSNSTPEPLNYKEVIAGLRV